FNDSWQNKKPCLASEIRCNRRPPEDKLVIRAHFFNDRKQLIETRNAPTMTDMGAATYVRIPDIGRTRQWYPFFFALDGALERNDWRWVVVYAEVDGEAV